MSPSHVEAGSNLLDDNKPNLEESFGNCTMFLIVFVVFFLENGSQVSDESHSCVMPKQNRTGIRCNRKESGWGKRGTLSQSQVQNLGFETGK